MKILIVLAATLAMAQTTADSFVARMMAFDKNQDGKLTRDEITDDRLVPLFDRADANEDGVVTKEELTAFYAKEQIAPQGGCGRGPGGEPGQIPPMFMRDQLNLTADQRKELDAIQKDVDEKLDKLLTADQKQRVKQMREQGPGRGPGGPPR